MQPESRKKFDAENRAAQQQLVEAFNRRRQVNLVSYREAVARRFQTDWATVPIDKPSFTGTRVLDDYPLEELAEYIDWSPLFLAWELHGKYPKIFDDPVVGPQARQLHDDARRLLDEIIAKKWLCARGVWFGRGVRGRRHTGFADDSLQGLCFHTLRQQGKARRLFMPWPTSSPRTTGRTDYFRGVRRHCGQGAAELAARFARGDDYNAIMAKALADRLAEALPSGCTRSRADWGYGRQEQLTNDDRLLRNTVASALPPPSGPDHTEKWLLFELLAAERSHGHPADRIVGDGSRGLGLWALFAHPQSRYFSADRSLMTRSKTTRAQGMKIKEIEHWLALNLHTIRNSPFPKDLRLQDLWFRIL